MQSKFLQNWQRTSANSRLSHDLTEHVNDVVPPLRDSWDSEAALLPAESIEN